MPDLVHHYSEVLDLDQCVGLLLCHLSLAAVLVFRVALIFLEPLIVLIELVPLPFRVESVRVYLREFFEPQLQLTSEEYGISLEDIS